MDGWAREGGGCERVRIPEPGGDGREGTWLASPVQRNEAGAARGILSGTGEGGGPCVEKLEKTRQIYRNPYTGLIASSEFAYSLKDEGTMKCLWVLADMMRRKPVDGHYLAGKEDFPIRILFYSGAEIYDIFMWVTGI